MSEILDRLLDGMCLGFRQVVPVHVEVVQQVHVYAVLLRLIVVMLLDDVVGRHVLVWQAPITFLQGLGRWNGVVPTWLLVRKTFRQCRADIVRCVGVKLWTKIIFG